MKEFVDKWLFDPTIGKFIAAAIGLLIVIVIVRFVSAPVETIGEIS